MADHKEPEIEKGPQLELESTGLGQASPSSSDGDHEKKGFPSTSADVESSTLEEVTLDPAKERKLVLKLDFAFIPIIMLTYISCFLDRSNIGM